MSQTPFHKSRKVSHQMMSDFVAPRREIWWWFFFVIASSSDRRCRNVLPGCTTIQACCSFPTSDFDSFPLRDCLPLHTIINCFSSASLAPVNWTYMAWVLISIPSNIRKFLSGPPTYPMQSEPCTVMAVWSAQKQEVVQVVHDQAYTFLLCHPFQSICDSCKDLRCWPKAKW